jgi:hypothetical protein
VRSHLARFKHSAGIIYRSVGPEVVATVPEQDGFHHLVEAGSAVWHLLAVPRTVPELVEMTAEVYGMPEAAIASDVEVLVDQLIGRGLIEEVIEADI